MINDDSVIFCDTECYQNYFLIKFKKHIGGKYIEFEKFNDSEFNSANVRYILSKYTLVTFNGIKFDSLIIAAALAGFSNRRIHEISQHIIRSNEQPWDVRKRFEIPYLEINQIDLIEVAPLKASLKIYAGRLGVPTLENLPIAPGDKIKSRDLVGMRTYCANDLDDTQALFIHLRKELDLRNKMGEQYGVNLLSKSDAQIAEAVISHELRTKYNIEPSKSKIPIGKTYRYKAPKNIKFKTPELQDVLRQYEENNFRVGNSGHMEFDFKIVEADRNKKGVLPTTKPKLKFSFYGTNYTAGIGGLHSREKKTAQIADKNTIVRDYDVKAFYPRIILNNRLFPKHLGKPFLKIFAKIVNDRLRAKMEEDKTKDGSLKIVINGTFGKFGSLFSFLYAPDLMMNVTVTGQLSLLMLIERFELAGVNVVSANTDGVVVKDSVKKEKLIRRIISDWEFDTNYEMKESNYVSLNSRDVNSYIAIKESECKGKGPYVDQFDPNIMLKNNPANQICTDAVKNFLIDGVPIEDTISECTDVRKFLTLRTVNGGAIKDGKLLGKAIRWYYGREELDAIHYVTNGNKVPLSDGGVPLMELGEGIPSDLDYPWYVEESHRILRDIGRGAA